VTTVLRAAHAITRETALFERHQRIEITDSGATHVDAIAYDFCGGLDSVRHGLSNKVRVTGGL
jgi:predicted transcriptional regulator of viral defense system